ncbi:MAG TPA: ribosome-associated translation inhibitor RaiA [Acidobacteriota bacterium]|nr:ribosome-associated translation inhibitor RaiA [Acidobacteriota bacterium]
METVIGGKGIDITPALRSFTENKLKKLERVFDGVMDVHVTLSVQKYLQIADLSVKTRQGGFSATAQTTDMYASINDAIDNLVKQARRQGRRVKSHKGQRRAPHSKVWPESTLEEEEEPSVGKSELIVERLPLKPLSVEEAMLQVRASDNGFIVFRNSTTEELNVIYLRSDGDIGLIEPR